MKGEERGNEEQVGWEVPKCLPDFLYLLNATKED
jgi:hypothetical protein